MKFKIEYVKQPRTRPEIIGLLEDETDYLIIEITRKDGSKETINIGEESKLD